MQTLYEDDAQTLWIGTRGGGLNKLDMGRTEISLLDLHLKPTDISVYGILQDDKKFLEL